MCVHFWPSTNTKFRLNVKYKNTNFQFVYVFLCGLSVVDFHNFAAPKTRKEEDECEKNCAESLVL